MLRLQVLMVITQLCLTGGSSDTEVKRSNSCNRFMLSCVEKTIERQFPEKNEAKAVSDCYVKQVEGQ